MTNFDNNDTEQDFTGAIIEKIKKLFENKIVLIAAVIVLAVIAAVIFVSAMLSKGPGGSGEKFETISELAQHAGNGEDKIFGFSKSGLEVTMRIADICSVDEESGETYTSLYYGDQYDQKYVFTDYIIKNKTSKDIVINCGSNTEGSLDLFLGYFNDGSDEWDEEDELDYCAFYMLYDRNLKDVVKNTDVVIGAKETKSFTLRYSMRSESINRCSGVYFCELYKDDDEFTKYAVMGIGKPVISCEFKNSELFPQMILDEKRAAENTEKKQSEILETAAPLKYQMKAIDSSSYIFSSINTGSGPYRLSVEIAAEGSAEGNLSAGISGYSAVMENDSIQGPIFELSYTKGLEVEKVKLIFEINEQARDNVLGKYTATSTELDGIKRFNVFMYDEEINASLPIETKFDLENNIVYAETDRCGTYALADMEIWFDMLTGEIDS